MQTMPSWKEQSVMREKPRMPWIRPSARVFCMCASNLLHFPRLPWPHSAINLPSLNSMPRRSTATVPAPHELNSPRKRSFVPHYHHLPGQPSLLPMRNLPPQPSHHLQRPRKEIRRDVEFTHPLKPTPQHLDNFVFLFAVALEYLHLALRAREDACRCANDGDADGAVLTKFTGKREEYVGQLFDIVGCDFSRVGDGEMG
ncbi:hypothetical protein P171DRAFT_205639 [Karstenula rhodostoma CBS 690.94]|uniref:Uncharacterized protein n=1 Tax=Karstenula rhodostoma CBS 690.94 TaxID=1392251 RepID=A0A9P4PRT9_9PLEO|nr:hypothetical protein P171DRAFT_205639 [Karstenula rhodostoma CBS 690.94]